jgi:hypothetical protein
VRAAACAVVAAALLALVACQEKLAAPGECPGICPGDRSGVADTVLTATPGLDSTYVGFVARGGGNSLRLTNGLDGAQERGIVRFVRLPDSVLVGDTLRPYTTDSVAIAFTVLGRDTLVPGLSVDLFRVPQAPTIDSTTTFAQIESGLTPANFVANIPIPDNTRSGTFRKVFSGAELPLIQIPAADTGVLTLAYRLSAPVATGLRIGSSAAGSSGPSFITYLTTAVGDTVQTEALPRLVGYNGFVAQSPQVIDSASTITVGGSPSARALVRFSLPPRIRDSTTIIRATLELTPLAPINGLPNDSVAVEVRALLSDLGAKSPRLASNTGQILLGYLTVGSSDTVRVDVTPLITLWQPPNRLPQSLFLALQPEGSSFSVPVFGSTRLGVAPRLHITYVLPYPFETP